MSIFFGGKKSGRKKTTGGLRDVFSFSPAYHLWNVRSPQTPDALVRCYACDQVSAVFGYSCPPVSLRQLKKRHAYTRRAAAGEMLIDQHSDADKAMSEALEDRETKLTGCLGVP